MGLDAVPGRITLSVTSLLALVTQFSALRKELPPVSYVNVRQNSVHAFAM